MLPEIPSHFGIPNPVEYGYIEQYLPYLMTEEKQPGEDYTYGSRLWPQVPKIIELLKKTPRTNQAILQVGRPEDINLADPPCLRHIDMRVKDGVLIFYPYFRSWDMWCIDEISEVLTDKGWRNIDTIRRTDIVACLDIFQNEIVYAPILGINKQFYNGKMVKLKNKRIDQLVTPNHKVLHKYRTHSGSKAVIRGLAYTRADKIIQKDGSNIPISAPWYGGEWTLGNTNKAALIGWILTDSHYRKRCKTIEIYQTEKKYHDDIRKVLNNLSFPFIEHKRTRTYYKIGNKLYPNGHKITMYTFVLPAAHTGWIHDLIPNRKPTVELLRLTMPERRAMFHSIIQADGSFKLGRNGTASFVFYSIILEKLEWVQLLAFSLGYRTLLNLKKGCLQISTKNQSELQYPSFYRRKLPQIDYSGRVWCVSTPESNFVMRRRGKISITGNSGYPANLAGIAVLQKYMADSIGVSSGPMICSSKGLHLYGYVEELAKLRTQKGG